MKKLNGILENARAMAEAPSKGIGPEVVIVVNSTPGEAIYWQERLTGLVELTHRGVGAAVVMVTHEVGHLPATCSRVVLLRAGTVGAAGRPADVLRPDLLAATYGCPMAVTSEGGRYHAHARPAGGVR